MSRRATGRSKCTTFCRCHCREATTPDSKPASGVSAPQRTEQTGCRLVLTAAAGTVPKEGEGPGQVGNLQFLRVLEHPPVRGPNQDMVAGLVKRNIAHIDGCHAPPWVAPKAELQGVAGISQDAPTPLPVGLCKTRRAKAPYLNSDRALFAINLSPIASACFPTSSMCVRPAEVAPD
jgi:hypothetical protein